MDIHPREVRSWFNGAQTGETVQCSGPFPFDSHSTGGGVTPMRRLLSPGGSERCSFLEQEQRSEETPVCPVVWAEGTETHAGSHISSTHTHLHPLHPWGGFQTHFQGNFWHRQLLSVRKWQVYSGFETGPRRRRGLTIEPVQWTNWAECLFVPLWGFFRWAPCLSLDVYTSLRFHCLISILAFKELDSGGVGAEEKTVSTEAWEKEDAAEQETRKTLVILLVCKINLIWGFWKRNFLWFKLILCFKMYFCPLCLW